MASKPRPPEWADKIKAGALMNRLHKHAHGEIELTQTQINAAKIYLGKTIPDLSTMKHEGYDGGPVQHDMTVRFVE